MAESALVTYPLWNQVSLIFGPICYEVCTYKCSSPIPKFSPQNSEVLKAFLISIDFIKWFVETLGAVNDFRCPKCYKIYDSLRVYKRNIYDIAGLGNRKY